MRLGAPARPSAAAQLPLLLLLAPLAAALIISAPESCGGTHVVTHATAFFGPKPGASNVRDVPLFAPRAQADGVYLRRVLPHLSARAVVHRRLAAPMPARPARALLAILVGLVSPVRYAARREVSRLARVDRPREQADVVVERAAWERNGEDVSDFILGGNGDAASAKHSDDGDVGPALDAEPEIAGGMRSASANDDAEMSVESEADWKRVTEADFSDASGKRAAAAEDPGTFSLFNACHKLSVPADIAAVKGRVAVVARGVCDFAQKVLFMQDAGAVGVIVVNFKDGGEHLANMKLNDTKKNPRPITIPAVMISFKDWAKIAPCRNDTMVVFTAEGEATFDIDYGRDALNWAMMRGMALWILCQCGVNVVRYKRRVSEFRARADAIAALPVETYSRPQSTREEAAGVSEEARRVDNVTESVPIPSMAGPAPSSATHDHDPERVGLISSDTESAAASSSAGPPASTASTAVEEEDEEEEEPVCAVCLEDFETGQQVRLLACSHLYHRSCIDPWLQSSSNSCPLCKREVPNLPPPPTQLHYGSMHV